MKCVNCNKEIPDSSVICPYCNGAVDPVVTAAPVFNTPEVDNTPVITSKEDMVVNNSPMVAAPTNNEVPATNEEITPVNVTLPVTPTEPQLPTDQNNLLVETAAQPVVTPEIINTSVEAPVEELADTPNVEEASTPAQPEEPTIEPPVSETISVSVPKEKKKINLPIKKIIIIAAIVLVLAGIGGGLFYYFTAFKSAGKRMQAFTNKIFEAPILNSLNSLNNKKVELSSGEYEYNLDLDFDQTKLTATLFGKYGVDIKNKNFDITLNLKDVKLSGTELISEKNPLSIELTSDADRVYVLLQNFFDKYLYIQVPEMGQVYDAIEQNDFDYTYFVNTMKDTFINAVNNMDMSQSNGSETINGETKKANIVTIKFSKDNAKKFSDSIKNSLKGNSKLISQLAKITGIDEKTISDGINSLEVSKDYDPGDVQFKLLTTFGGDFIGAKLGDKDFSIELSLDGDKYKFVIYDEGKKTAELTLSETIEKAAATNTRNGLVDLTMFMDDTAFKSSVTYKLVENVNPKVEKINTKNSINIESLTETDLNQMLTKVSQFGMFGTLFNEYYNQLIYSGVKEQIISGVKCSEAVSCTQISVTQASCKYCADDACTQPEIITCAIN